MPWQQANSISVPLFPNWADGRWKFDSVVGVIVSVASPRGAKRQSCTLVDLPQQLVPLNGETAPAILRPLFSPVAELWENLRAAVYSAASAVGPDEGKAGAEPPRCGSNWSVDSAKGHSC